MLRRRLLDASERYILIVASCGDDISTWLSGRAVKDAEATPGASVMLFSDRPSHAVETTLALCDTRSKLDYVPLRTVRLGNGSTISHCRTPADLEDAWRFGAGVYDTLIFDDLESVDSSIWHCMDSRVRPSASGRCHTIGSCRPGAIPGWVDGLFSAPQEGFLRINFEERRVA